jgi:hypothetical protein
LLQNVTFAGGVAMSGGSRCGFGRAFLAIVLTGLGVHVSGAVAQPASPPPLPGQDQPPPLPQRPAVTFHVENQGRAEGPLSLDHVAERIRAGTLARTTLVWKAGTPAWQRAEEIEELAAFFAARPPELSLAHRLERLILGTWQLSGPMAGMHVVTTLRYHPDGTYSGVQQAQMLAVNAPPVSIPVSGRWSIEVVSDSQFALTLTPADGTMRQTATITVLDENTLRNETAGAIARRVAR